MNDIVFVTGFPGALAKRFVESSLDSSTSEICLLTEAAHIKAAKDLAAKEPERIRLLEGSTKKIDFGLSGKQYLELGSKITKIAHLEMPSVPGSNQIRARQAAREVIELSLISEHLDHILVLSHVDVCGNMSGSFAEHDLELGQGFMDPTQEDRYRAERVYRRFMDSLPITIARSGWIVGSDEEACPIVELLVASDDPSMLPNKEPLAPLYIIPLEHLAQTITKILYLSPSQGGATVHCISQELPNISKLMSQFKKAASRLLPEGFEQAAGARRVLRNSRWSPKDFYKRQPTRARISTSFSDGYLRQRSVEQIRWNEDVVHDLTTKAIEGIVGFK